jgi:hypothetical protein
MFVITENIMKHPVFKNFYYYINLPIKKNKNFIGASELLFK